MRSSVGWVQDHLMMILHSRITCRDSGMQSPKNIMNYWNKFLKWQCKHTWQTSKFEMHARRPVGNASAQVRRHWRQAGLWAKTFTKVFRLLTKKHQQGLERNVLQWFQLQRVRPFSLKQCWIGATVCLDQLQSSAVLHWQANLLKVLEAVIRSYYLAKSVKLRGTYEYPSWPPCKHFKLNASS